MFKSVRIQNFRQFKDLKLDGLAQINLISGKNNTGKTSLLEALFLLDGPLDPARTITIASHRGVDRISPEVPEVWDWLFFDLDLSRKIVFDAVMWHETSISDSDIVRLSISATRRGFFPFVNESGEVRLLDQTTPSVISSVSTPELLYEAARPSGHVDLTLFRWTRQGLLLEPDRGVTSEDKSRPFFMWDRHTISSVDADRLSELEAIGREQDVVNALRRVDPRIHRLSVYSQAGRPSVRVDLGNRILVPLVLMGRGFSNLFTLVSSLIRADARVFLIDEFGSGLHHSALVDVWRAVASVAVENDVQIFATTHSLEAIQAAVEGTQDHEGSLAFFRLQRQGDDVEVVKGEDFRLRAAARVGTELR